MRGYKTVQGGWQSKIGSNTIGKMNVPCEGCIGCRTDRRKEWAARIMHEASQYESNSFLTLTYNDEQLPKDGSLDKSHHRNFIKRLRQHYPKTTMKYYMCGEYGDITNRPHYHSALMGLEFPDEILWSHNDGNPLYTSETLEKIWGHGHAKIGQLQMQSAEYVAGYILKKITGQNADDHYRRYDNYGNPYWLQEEYNAMSKGIGEKWFKKYWRDVYPSDEMPVPGVGVVSGPPRYYEKLMEGIDNQVMQEVKNKRAKFAKSHPELYTRDHLDAQYKIYKANQARKERTL